MEFIVFRILFSPKNKCSLPWLVSNMFFKCSPHSSKRHHGLLQKLAVRRAHRWHRSTGGASRFSWLLTAIANRYFSSWFPGVCNYFLAFCSCKAMSHSQVPHFSFPDPWCFVGVDVFFCGVGVHLPVADYCSCNPGSFCAPYQRQDLWAVIIMW